MASKVVKKRILNLSLSNSLNGVCPSCRSVSLILPRTTRRHASNTIAKWATAPKGSSNTHLNPYLNQAPKAFMDKMPKKVQKEPEPDGMARGTPSEESIFARDNEGVPEEEQVEPAEKPLHEEIDPDALMNVLDPEPAKRLAWQRKKVIQQIRKRGELTKDEIIKRTERECQVGSAMFKVSTKKLVHLARQIAGKPIGEAIVQMQLSKKRAAQDVMKHLEYAKNLAIVSRGMGLGQAEGRQGEPLDIELKDGKRKRITDQTGIYVDQAWVNKGNETVTPDYRGRGRIFGHRHRTAKITVILKEEATRIRLSEERREKLNNRKLWLHLPDRPITLQRQYPLW